MNNDGDSGQQTDTSDTPNEAKRSDRNGSGHG